MLLRKRNKLRRSGRAEQANHIALEINKLIAHNRSTARAGAEDTDTKQLWALLKQTGNWDSSEQAGLHRSDPNEINDFFADIASDPNYSRDFVMQAAETPDNGPSSSSAVTYTTVEKVWSRVRRTSPGCDDTPYWVWRDCAPELADVATKIIDMSIGIRVVPASWRSAVITPVPKCTPVARLGDLRPISVTPILSRVVDRSVVKDHIFPPFDLISCVTNLVSNPQQL